VDLFAQAKRMCCAYWEQEFPQLSPVSCAVATRRYTSARDVLMIRSPCGVLYDQGFTIGGARRPGPADGAKDKTSPITKQLIRHNDHASWKSFSSGTH